MPTVYFGGKNDPGFQLEQSEDLIVVRTHSGRSATRSAGAVPTPLAGELDDATLVVSYPEAGVEVYRVPSDVVKSLDTRKSALRAAPDV